MPLLPFSDSLYSASRRKSRNFSFDTRLLAFGSLVMTPSSIDQPIGRVFIWTSQASSDLPSNRVTGLPKACDALASQAAQVGGRSPATFTWPTVPVSLFPAARSVTVGRFCAVPPTMNVSSSPVILAPSAGTGLPPRFRKTTEGLPASSLTSSQASPARLPAAGHYTTLSPGNPSTRPP